MNIREKVGERLAQTGPEIEKRVIDHFAEIEVAKRSNAIVAAMEKLDANNKELNKLSKPDQVSYNLDGSIKEEAFSKERIDARAKLIEKNNKISKAIEKALGGDYGDIFNLKD